MRYKGGYNIQPVKTNYQGVAQQYGQGKALAEKERELVRKERSEQLAKLAEESKFEVTSLTSLDNAFLGAADEMRKSLHEAHKANIRGEGSRSAARTELSNQIGQAQYVSNIATLKKTQKEDIEKRIEEGKASAAELDAWQFDWLQQKGAASVITDADGSKRAAVRKVVPKMINQNGKNTLSFIVQQEYMDENGELQVFTGVRPVSEVANPDKKTYEQVTVLGKAEEMLKVISNKREFAVGPGGLTKPNAIFDMRDQIGTARFKQRIIAPELFSDVQNNLELQLQSLSDEDIVSILYDSGAKSVLSDGFQGYRSKEVLDNTYSTGAKPTMFGPNGDPVQFNKDPMVIEINEEGLGFEVTEDNRKMAQALLRSQYYIGLDVTLDDIRGSIARATSGRAKEEEAGFGGFYYNKATNANDPQSVTSNVPLDANYVKGILAGESLARELFSGQTMTPGADRAFIDFRNQFSKRGVVPNSVITGSFNQSKKQYFQKVNGDDADVVGRSFGGFTNVIKDKVDVTSIEGFEFQSLNGMMAVDTGDGVSVFLVGDADIASAETAIKAGGGTSAGSMASKLGLDRTEKLPVMSDRLTDSQLRVIWSTLYRKNIEFKSWADESGYGYDPKPRNAPGANFTEGINHFFEEWLEIK